MGDSSIKASKFVIVSDENVWKLYGAQLAAGFAALEGVTVHDAATSAKIVAAQPGAFAHTCCGEDVLEDPSGNKLVITYQVPHGEGRLPRLGSCWGGWDCSNPSYLAPAHYRAFRRYMLRHGARFGSTADEGERAAAQWEALVRASYAMLGEAQCPSTGLTPNWWQPAGPQRPRGRTGCNSSGTDADEFGSEAVRSRWCGSGWCGR